MVPGRTTHAAEFVHMAETAQFVDNAAGSPPPRFEWRHASAGLPAGCALGLMFAANAWRIARGQWPVVAALPRGAEDSGSGLPIVSEF